jgi:hypothetical protein
MLACRTNNFTRLLLYLQSELQGMCFVGEGSKNKSEARFFIEIELSMTGGALRGGLTFKAD